MLSEIKHVAGDTFVFQQESAPFHAAKVTIKLLQQESWNSVVLIFGRLIFYGSRCIHCVSKKLPPLNYL